MATSIRKEGKPVYLGDRKPGAVYLSRELFICISLAKLPRPQPALIRMETDPT